MRAGAGAIDSVHVRDGGLDCHVIGGGAARGICGSGLVDAAACGVELGLIGANGRLTDTRTSACRSPMASHWRRATSASCNWPRARWRRACACSPAEASKQLCLAGAFGNYIRQASARAIGLLPERPAGRARGQQRAARRAHATARALHAPGAAAEDCGAIAARRARRRPRFPIPLCRDDGASPATV